MSIWIYCLLFEYLKNNLLYSSINPSYLLFYIFNNKTDIKQPSDRSSLKTKITKVKLRGVNVNKTISVGDIGKAVKWKVSRCEALTMETTRYSPYQNIKPSHRHENVHFYSFSLCNSMNKFALFFRTRYVADHKRRRNGF